MNKELDKIDKEILFFVQGDLPLTSNPFLGLADYIGVDEDEICGRIEDMKESGLIRRFGAIVRHRKAGFNANAMVVWKIAESKQDDAAAILAESDAVSHLYSRPAFPDWPSNLFSMIHAREEDELQELLNGFAEKLKAYSDEHKVLRTVREFKKTSMQYFMEEE
jgi:DNA-binding Lrp family transcriptional regulator